MGLQGHPKPYTATGQYGMDGRGWLTLLDGKGLRLFRVQVFGKDESSCRSQREPNGKDIGQ